MDVCAFEFTLFFEIYQGYLGLSMPARLIGDLVDRPGRRLADRV